MRCYLKRVSHSQRLCKTDATMLAMAASYQLRSPNKNWMTDVLPIGSISVVILIRTDTTLDLSQKAEKVCNYTIELKFVNF